MVARSVTRQEVTKTLAASQSLNDKAQMLVQKGAWDPTGVRERKQVADAARKTGEKAEVGRIFGIVVETHRASSRAPRTSVQGVTRIPGE